MRRYVGAPLSEFESLFSRAGEGLLEIESAEYPKGCRLSRGVVQFAAAPDGGLVLHVDRCACVTREFRLGWLFRTGSSVFTSPADLASFWNTVVAEAFGIDPSPAVVEADPPSSDGTGSAPRQNPLDHEGDATSRSCDREASSRKAPRKEKPLRAASTFSATANGKDPFLTTDTLVSRLSQAIYGQEPALERVASIVVAQLSKRRPACPGCVALLGPTGVGKTATMELLPSALSDLGVEGVHLYRIDCNELSEAIQLTRVFGAPPGYVGHSKSTSLIEALERPRCILLLDEIEKAHTTFLQNALLSLLDRGRLSTPTGKAVECASAVIALTTNLEVSELELVLRNTDPHDRWTVQRACRTHLREAGFPAELVARIGAFAYFSSLGPASFELAAEKAIRDLAQEYGLQFTEIDPIVTKVVLDIADESDLGVRALYHAARELLGEPLVKALARGVAGRVAVGAGPPISITAARRKRSGATSTRSSPTS